MGEISEALRRAREGLRVSKPVDPPLAPAVVSRSLEAPAAVLSIPAEESESDRARIVLTRPDSPIAERYRHSAVRILRELRERGARSLLIASAGVGEGKTTTACNLALALASIASERRTALVELDLRRPTAAQALGVAPAVGIAAALEGARNLASARCATQLPALDLYLATKTSRNPLPLISSPRFGALIAELEREYDHVILDSPPILPVPDASVLCERVGATLLVTRVGTSRRAALTEAIEKIGRDAVIGIFLNERRESRHYQYSEYYNYQPRDEKESAEGKGSGHGA